MTNETRKASRFRTRVTLTFEVNTEFTPGMFFNADDYAKQSMKAIQDRLYAYVPELIASEWRRVNYKERKDVPTR